VFESSPTSWPDAVMCIGLVVGVVVCVFCMAKYVWGPCTKPHVEEKKVD